MTYFLKVSLNSLCRQQQFDGGHHGTCKQSENYFFYSNRSSLSIQGLNNIEINHSKTHELEKIWWKSECWQDNRNYFLVQWNKQ